MLLLAASHAHAEALVPGHQARLLTSGKASFTQRFKNIADADVVFCKTYAFLDDETGHEMVEALRQRALAGKPVFLEYDVKGTANGGALGLIGQALGIGRALPAYLQPLVDADATVMPTNMPTIGSPLFGRDHDKLLVTWKAGEPVRVIMGGMNVGNHYAWSGSWDMLHLKPGLAYRDTDIEITGPETAHIMDRFIEAAAETKPGKTAMARLVAASTSVSTAPGAFNRQSGPHGASLRFYSNDPKARTGKRTIERLYERLISETPAGETITFANAYTLLTARAQKAVVAAAERGVKFHFIVNAPDAEETEASSLGYAFRDQLRSVLRKVPSGSVDVTEFSGNALRHESIIHQKIAKFGASGPVVVGSHNLDSLSANFNAEAVAVVKGHRVSQQFDGLVNRMMREGTIRKVDVDALRHDPLTMRAHEFVMHRVVGKGALKAS